MSNPRVFVTRIIPDKGLEMLREAAEVEVWPEELPPPYEVLLEKVKGLDGLLTLLSDKIDAPLMDAAGASLKVISQMAVGVDNIDIPAATGRGIPIGNTPGVLTETTADLAWALLMAAARRVVEGDKFTRAGRWKTWGPTLLMGTDVHGATLGIVGFGRIGQAVARRAAGFGMRIMYNNVQDCPEPDPPIPAPVECVDLNDLLRESDFVTLHAPLSRQTYHMLGDEQFNRMKPGAILINTARGPIVDQAALYRALASGQIAYAALDVTDPEPVPMDSPLLTLDNIIIVPHIASASIQTRTKMATMAAANLIAGLRGERLPNCANPQVYSHTSEVSETLEVPDAVTRVRNQWSPVIQAATSACAGNAQAAAQLAPFLDEMSQKDDWRKLVAVLRRILAGERDPLVLLPGLDDTDLIITSDVLRGLGVDVPAAGQELEDDGGDMVSLQDFLQMVVRACQPDAPPALREQLHKATLGMATQPNAPPGMRELGSVLNRVLSGEREPDLSVLPPQFADMVRGVLDPLK